MGFTLKRRNCCLLRALCLLLLSFRNGHGLPDALRIAVLCVAGLVSRQNKKVRARRQGCKLHWSLFFQRMGKQHGECNMTQVSTTTHMRHSICLKLYPLLTRAQPNIPQRRRAAVGGARKPLQMAIRHTALCQTKTKLRTKS